MRFTDLIDVPFSFLFPLSTGRLREKLRQKLSDNDWYKPIIVANELVHASLCASAYKIQIQRYWGFGIVLSFIPGTLAFKLRKDYVVASLSLEAQIINELLYNQDKVQKLTFSMRMSRLVQLTPLFFLSDFIFIFLEKIKRTAINIFTTQMTPWRHLFAPRTRLWTPDNHEKSPLLFNALLSLINPFRPITTTLEIIHLLSNKLVDFGSERGKKTSYFKAFLKTLVAIILLPPSLISLTLEKSTDLVFKMLWQIASSPLIFFYRSLEQMRRNWKKSYFLTTAGELQGAKIIHTLRKRETSTLVGKNKQHLALTKKSHDQRSTDYSCPAFRLFGSEEYAVPKQSPVMVIKNKTKIRLKKNDMRLFRLNKANLSEGEPLTEQGLKRVKESINNSVSHRIT